MKTLNDISQSISIKENMQSGNIKSGPDTTTSTNDCTTIADGTTTMKKPPPQSLPSHPPSVLLEELSSHITNSTTSIVPTSELSLAVSSDNHDTTTRTTAPTKTDVDKTLNPIPPTYQSSEESIYYTNAKALLQSGDFETALSTIEEGIQWTKEQLLLIQNSTVKSDTGRTENSAALHESMAPFHYLYGTTLLYSIEEAPDDGLQPLTMMEGGGQGGEPSSQSGEEDEGAGDDDDDEVGPYIDTNNMGYEDNEQQQGPQSMVEDMEIAWENLDAARIIVERMLQTNPTSDKLRMDMGQILLREGDLQRMNGAYMAAITDYTNCLSFYDNNSMISPFCRKVADVHCNLGSVYFNSVVEMKKGPADVDKDNGATQQQETMTMSDPTLTKKIIFHRNRGFYHYYECAKTLVGMIVQVLSSSSSSTKPMDPMVVFEKVDGKQSFPSSYYNERCDDYPTMIRSKLHTLVQDVKCISKSTDVSSFHDSDLILDSLALLEEIQETIDEAETSEQGVVEATAMKKEITALVASQQQGKPEDSDGNAISGSSSITTNGFGSAAAAASTAIAQPILIVKKKKKMTQQEPTDQEAMDELGMDVKLPAIRNDSNKRMKSSE